MGNKPRIRFKGFTEDWEQRKLSELATMNARIGWQNLRTSEFLDSGDYLLITGTDFDNGRIKYGTCHYVEKKRFDQDTKIQLSTGSILITKDGTLGKVALVEELPKPATLNAGVFNVRVKDDAVLSYKYLYHYLKAPFLMKYVTANATGGTIKHLNQSILVDFPIPITEKLEQDRIAKLLDSLELSITLHQCKLEKLKLTKKALLQKLFPKNGKHIPEIRFKGFTDAWEQRKFLDLLDAQNGIRRGPFGSSLKKDSFVKKSDYVVYEQQNAIYDNYETRYFISKEKYNELIRFNIQPGDFIMSGAGTIGRISMVPDGIKKGVFNQALIRFKVNKDSINPLYFLKFMQSDMMQKQLTQANPGSAMTNLVPMDELKKWDVTIPSLEEQNKISNFINQIDESITLHQCKLKKLNLAKKSPLQKLFPRNGSQIPGVRFKGFTDAWEQRKLGDLAEIVRGASPRPISDSKWFDNNSDVGWLRISDVTAQDGRIQYLEQKISKLGQDKTRVVKTPHLLLSIAATVGKPVINYVPTGVHDGFLIFLNPKFNILYAFWWLEIFREEWNKYGQPGSQVNLNSDLVKNQVINIPNEKEQEKISSFLEALDRIITLHQRKLERLQEVKKGLLQKMFV